MNETKEQNGTTRHFIVLYLAKYGFSTCTWQINITITGIMPFLNRNKCIELISENNAHLKFEEIVITNFIEISEGEYKEWTR